VCVCELVS